ncbi:hypothetical protein [Pseudoalteromonas sp. MMG022]|uniref:hypothetical protein n=1 Tax=Pseudoalteromonas sp. MMG022 TaxID=2909978 RepID=UPI001F23B021|nr:hypothetical protein [Pseudoalteromonas sp. MMG022]MCF6437220.1 hypothetical protein [Pseudoalteromonas sp. MMG022]
MFRLVVIALGLLFFPFANAQNPEHLAQEAYLQALKHIVQARSAISDGRSIAFVEISENRTGSQKTKQRQLRLNEHGNEVLYPKVKPSDEDELINWQSSIMVEPNRFPKQAKLIRETKSTWILSIPTTVSAKIDESNQEVDSSKINKRIQSSLVTELTVSKQSPRFLALKVFAKKPFNPEAMVKVHEFIVRFEFAEAWSGGPLITRTVSKVLTGSYAFFIDIEAFSITRYEQFQIVN